MTRAAEKHQGPDCGTGCVHEILKDVRGDVQRWCDLHCIGEIADQISGQGLPDAIAYAIALTEIAPQTAASVLLVACRKMLDDARPRCIVCQEPFVPNADGAMDFTCRVCALGLCVVCRSDCKIDSMNPAELRAHDEMKATINEERS